MKSFVWFLFALWAIGVPIYCGINGFAHSRSAVQDTSVAAIGLMALGCGWALAYACDRIIDGMK